MGQSLKRLKNLMGKHHRQFESLTNGTCASMDMFLSENMLLNSLEQCFKD